MSSAKQMWVAAVPVGATGKQLNSTFSSRDTVAYKVGTVPCETIHDKMIMFVSDRDASTISTTRYRSISSHLLIINIGIIITIITILIIVIPYFISVDRVR